MPIRAQYRSACGALLLVCGLITPAFARADEPAADDAGTVPEVIDVPDAGEAAPVPPPAIAQAPVAPAPTVTFDLHASYRLIGSEQSDLQLGVSGQGAPENLGHRFFFEHQLRVGGRLAFPKQDVEVLLDADLVKGLFSTGGTDGVLPVPAVPAGGVEQPLVADPLRNRAYAFDPSSFALRQLMVKWKTKYALLSLGATTFNFGMGVLANNAGTFEDPGFDAALGDQRFGDRVVRAAISTRPGELFGTPGGLASKFIVSLAADLVLEDSTATLVRPLDQWRAKGVFADRAVGGLLALVFRDTDGEAGLIVTRRSIFFSDTQPLDAFVTKGFGTDLSAWAFDLAADGHHKMDSGLELKGALEGTVVVGNTNHVRNDSCPGVTDAQRCNVIQGGLAARAGFSYGILSADLLGGYASGDANPFDDQVTNFKLARDFQAGFILFDQVIAWQSAAQVRRASDPLLTNAPPAGVELLSTNGSVTNAVFLQPTLKVRVIPELTLLASVLWARAAVPYEDAMWTTRAGKPTNAFGQHAGLNYGVELDAGANFKKKLGAVTAHAGLAVGVLLPGDAFLVDATGRTMDAVHRVKVRLGVWF